MSYFKGWLLILTITLMDSHSHIIEDFRIYETSYIWFTNILYQYLWEWSTFRRSEREAMKYLNENSYWCVIITMKHQNLTPITWHWQLNIGNGVLSIWCRHRSYLCLTHCHLWPHDFSFNPYCTISQYHHNLNQLLSIPFVKMSQFP